MTSEVNENEFYILNNKNRACCLEDDQLVFTDAIGSETVKSWKTKDSAEKFLKDNFSAKEIKEENIRVVLESDVCSYGYYVDEENMISPVYTLNTLLNRATNERYHKNIMDAQFFVEDAPNREKKKEQKKAVSAAQRIKKQAEEHGLTVAQYLKQLGLA